MSNLFTIKLKQIKYSGDNLGRELKIKFQIGDETSVINIKLPCGERKSLNKIILQKALKSKTTRISLTAEATETREKHIDSGNIIAKLIMPLKEGTAKEETLKVLVIGAGKEKGKTATITLVLESFSASAIRYIPKGKNGWLTVKCEDGNAYALPQFLKVETLKIDGKREYFVILEGVLKGKKASVKLDEDGKSFLLTSAKHTKVAKLTFDQKAKKLTIDGLGTYNIKISHYNPIPLGKYDIKIPDAPHEGGTGYLEYSKYAKTWFGVGHEGDRYLHVGRASAGCVTVIDKYEWTTIYNFLIKSRKDAFNVGELIVK